MMRIGKKVMLVGSDGYMPPFGAIGVIDGPIDEYGDYPVSFAKYPCPIPPGTHWEAHHTWLMPLDDDKSPGQELAISAHTPQGGDTP